MPLLAFGAEVASGEGVEDGEGVGSRSRPSPTQLAGSGQSVEGHRLAPDGRPRPGAAGIGAMQGGLTLSRPIRSEGKVVASRLGKQTEQRHEAGEASESDDDGPAESYELGRLRIHLARELGCVGFESGGDGATDHVADPFKGIIGVFGLKSLWRGLGKRRGRWWRAGGGEEWSHEFRPSRTECPSPGPTREQASASVCWRRSIQFLEGCARAHLKAFLGEEFY